MRFSNAIGKFKNYAFLTKGIRISYVKLWFSNVLFLTKRTFLKLIQKIYNFIWNFPINLKEFLRISKDKFLISYLFFSNFKLNFKIIRFFCNFVWKFSSLNMNFSNFRRNFCNSKENFLIYSRFFSFFKFTLRILNIKFWISNEFLRILDAFLYLNWKWFYTAWLHLY